MGFSGPTIVSFSVADRSSQRMHLPRFHLPIIQIIGRLLIPRFRSPQHLPQTLHLQRFMRALMVELLSQYLKCLLIPLHSLSPLKENNGAHGRLHLDIFQKVSGSGCHTCLLPRHNICQATPQGFVASSSSILVIGSFRSSSVMYSL